MPLDKLTAEDNLRLINDIAVRSEKYFDSHRRVFLLWGVITILAGGISHLMNQFGRSSMIFLVWLIYVITGMTGSVILSRMIKSKAGVKPALLRYLILLWVGGSMTIISIFLAGLLGKVFHLMYMPALTFPVIALCTLVSAGLFRARSGYFIAGIFFLATIPSIIFPQWSLLIQAVLCGGGLLLIGMKRNG